MSSQSPQTTLSSPFIVHIANLPYRSEPAYVRRLFPRSDRIKEIEMYPETFVFFNTAEDAAESARYYNGHWYGPSHIYSKLDCQVVPPSLVPKDKTNVMRLSDFRRQEESAIRTKTVRITKICTKTPTSHVLEMCERELPDGTTDDEPAWCKYIHPEPGSFLSGALVRFSSVDAANMIVRQYNGNHWKNSTIYARCVPDEELDEILEAKAEADGTPTIKIFIPAIKKGTTVPDLCNVFKPLKVRDVNIPLGGKFAFVFMNASEAAKLLKEHPKHKNFNGWKYNFKVDKKDKAKLPVLSSATNPVMTEERDIGALNSLAEQASALTIEEPKPDTYPSVPIEESREVRVTNLAYKATEEKVRDFFVGFSISKVTIDNGEAVVELASLEEAERAVLQLSRKKLLKRQVMVQLAARSA